jgi:hypothetical protein
MKMREFSYSIGWHTKTYDEGIVKARNLRAAKRLVSKRLAEVFVKSGREMMYAWVWEGHYFYEKKIYIPDGETTPKVTRWPVKGSHIIVSQ